MPNLNAALGCAQLEQPARIIGIQKDDYIALIQGVFLKYLGEPFSRTPFMSKQLLATDNTFERRIYVMSKGNY